MKRQKSLAWISGIVVILLLSGLFSSPSAVQAVANIPAGATITSATLSLFVDVTDFASIRAHRILSNWDELTVTWNNFGTSDFDPTVLNSFSSAPGWRTLDVTTLVQGWVDGTYPNYGLLLDELDPTSYTTLESSEAVTLANRPKLDVCYTTPADQNPTCLTIQRPGDPHVDVLDAYIWQNAPDTNNGNNPELFAGILPGGNGLKMTLIRFDIAVVKTPAVSIVKMTNGAVASDPNGAGVPQINPGDPITWTYEVTNTGQTSIPQADVVVTDNQSGVTPVFDHEVTGNADAVFDPGEVWQFKATGTAVNLLLPPPAVVPTPNGCTLGGVLPPHNAYVNIGTVTVPGATAQAPSSYCNKPDVSIVKMTNGAVASDPNGAGVPQIKPGDPVTWTYEVTNTGPVPIKKADVVVTDNQTGVTPVFDHEISGNADLVFDPGEVWQFKASGIAVDLSTPLAGVITVQNSCSNNDTQKPRTAYVNQGTVTIPGVTKSAQSSYCNPSVYHLYMPFGSQVKGVVEQDWQLALGYEDLPLITGQNDFDYNDWTVDVNGSDFYDAATPTLINKMMMSFLPHARGAIYDHRFQVLIPANVFKSNGTVVYNIYDAAHHLISSTSTPFNGAAGGTYVIFPNTSQALPGDFVNTYESSPFTPPQRFADLTFTFDTPFNFVVNESDMGLAHGTGVFFDPFLTVLNTGDQVHVGDLRMLTVPSTDYLWPEEKVRIDKAYPDIQFIPGPTPEFTFPAFWWTNHNHCVYDGVACVQP